MNIRTRAIKGWESLTTALYNARFHANTKAFTNAFFPALGWGFGLLPALLVYSWVT